ncbi:hypothetical protein [Ralstonia phage RSF1]|uniref:Uncharacterized protein n=1 Tax=Ralstonia phage RSF1 TaxID=1689679 RepID=A0A0K2QRM6_9CAUD|nr:hypothetical protein AVU11_gp224 [Ralstonia phage RSF1]BAS05016.1 hypothetical protein [Ralstonia phage RSF1]
MKPKTQEELDNKLDNTAPRQAEPPTDVAQPHPRQKQAMEVFEALQKNRRMGIGIDIRGISNQLTLVEQNSQFPEELFVEHFLPLFAGEVAPTAHVNYQTWLEKVAGGEKVSVDIVDTQGNVLFTVPPLFDTSILEQAKPGGESMTLIERHYSRLKEFDAAGSQVFLNRKLSGLHIKDKPTEQVYENIRIWNAIFERYGKHDKILNLINLQNDPNKDKAVGLSSAGGRNAADVGDYELDTD